MSTYHLEYLSREEYISSTTNIEDKRSIKFADMSLKWWDKKFGWYEKGCVVLSSEKNIHLSYLFYKIDRYNNYLTIHNIFTPENKRRHGYAETLLLLIFKFALTQKVKRFRLTCISNSLDFYLSLGFIYWGVNSVGDFYCDLPMPKSGLEGVKEMTNTFTTKELIGKSFDIISKKTSNYSENLTHAQKIRYDNDVIRLNKNYFQESFHQLKSPN
ncbi:MAG: GNAT family N-acetyltransferase [Campylobacterales bacterium]|nr:GNAT family N-acetyltransferase [Campylobacterales bacterium]